MPAPQICVVAPMHNEAGNAARLAAEVYDVLRDIPHEIVFVNDASTDSTLDELVAAKADIPSLRVISHRSNAGQSRAIRSGVMAATAHCNISLKNVGKVCCCEFLLEWLCSL